MSELSLNFDAGGFDVVGGASRAPLSCVRLRPLADRRKRQRSGLTRVVGNTVHRLRRSREAVRRLVLLIGSLGLLLAAIVFALG